MYVPEDFALVERGAVLDVIARHPLATLATNGPEGPLVTQLPLVLETGADGHDRVCGHFARANPHWREAAGERAVAVFRGADGYITPSWYATKRETGKVVPTWNYIAVQARGRIALVTDPGEARTVVERLTVAMEAGRARPWAVGDAPVPYVEAMLRGIVAFRMAVTDLTGAAKMSQNKVDADRAGVRAGLAGEPEGRAATTAMDRWTADR